MKALDITGKSFAHLTVLKRAGADARGRAKWLCICDCGNKTTVRGDGLRLGDHRSCGCRMRNQPDNAYKITQREIRKSRVRVGRGKHPK